MFPLGTHLNFGGLEARNMVIQNLAVAPAAPKEGQKYYNLNLHMEMVWNGTAWRPTDAAGLTDGTIKIAALEVDPRDRAQHTGTQLANTISNLDAVIKSYRLDQLTAPNANLTMNNFRLTALADGLNPTDAVTLQQMTSAIQAVAAGIDSKPSVRVLAINSVTLSGTQTIDGVGLNVNDRVLCVGQTDATKNGTYVVQSGAWIRAIDADQTGEITPGAFWFVEEGLNYGKTQWRCNNTGTITLGTTSIQIVQFGAAQVFTAVFGVKLEGSVFSVQVVPNGGIIATANGIQVDTAVVARKAAGTLAGDGSTTSFTFQHNLGTLDVVWSLRDVTSGQMILADITVASANTLTIAFAVAPPTGTNYRIVAMG